MYLSTYRQNDLSTPWLPSIIKPVLYCSCNSATRDALAMCATEISPPKKGTMNWPWSRKEIMISGWDWDGLSIRFQSDRCVIKWHFISKQQGYVWIYFASFEVGKYQLCLWYVFRRITNIYWENTTATLYPLGRFKGCDEHQKQGLKPETVPLGDEYCEEVTPVLQRCKSPALFGPFTVDLTLVAPTVF